MTITVKETLRTLIHTTYDVSQSMWLQTYSITDYVIMLPGDHIDALAAH